MEKFSPIRLDRPLKSQQQTSPEPPSPIDSRSVVLSPEAEFENFTGEVAKQLDRFKDQTFTKKEAWFIFNSIYLKFVGKCRDPELRDEAFKIAKYYAENVPAKEDIKDTELDRPYASDLNMRGLLSDRQDGRVLLPEEVK